MTDFADMLLTPQRKNGGTDNQQVDTDFAAEILGSNRTTSGRQVGSGNFPRVDAPTSAVSDPRMGASASTAFIAGIPTDPQSALRYFAKKRGIPEDRYAFLDGDIVYRADDGRWYKEVAGFLPNIAYRVPDVAEAAPGIGFGIATAPIAATSPVGAAAAMGITGTVDGLANAVRQKIAGRVAGQDFDTGEAVVSGLLSAGSEAVPAVRGAIKERRLVSDFGQRNLAMERRLRSLSGQYDVPLTVAEITNLPSLITQQKVLGNVAPSSNKMGEMYKVREEKARRAVDDYLNQLSTVDDVADAGKMGQDALFAQKAVLEKERDDAVSPLYRKAFDMAMPVDTTPVIAKIDGMLKTAPAGGVMEKYLNRMKNLVQGNDLETLQNSKFELDAMFKEGDFSSLEKKLQRQLTGVQTDLVTAMGKNNPDYLAANAKFAELSKPLEEFNNRITGTSLTKIPQDNLKNFASRIFENPSPKTVSYAKEQIIEGGGQEAWDAIVRAHLDNAWSKAKKPVANATTGKLDAGNSWNNILFGDQKQDAALRVALEPKQYQALKDLAHLLEAAGRVKKLGSDTAFNQLITEELMKNPPVGSVETGAARAAGAILQPQNYGKLISDWAIRRDAEKNADKLVDIIQNPAAVKKLRELRKMSNTEARWWAGMAQVLGDAGVFEYREPADSSVGVSTEN